MPEIETQSVRMGIDLHGRPCLQTVTVYAPVEPRRARQLLRKGTGKTSGRNTRAGSKCGLGSWKGCK